ncbi:hypothetical protein, partial [Paenibacillus alba]
AGAAGAAHAAGAASTTSTAGAATCNDSAATCSGVQRLPTTYLSESLRLCIFFLVGIVFNNEFLQLCMLLKLFPDFRTG